MNKSFIFSLTLALLWLVAGCGAPNSIEATKTNSIEGLVNGKNGPLAGAKVQLSTLVGDSCAAVNDKSIIDPNAAQTQTDIDTLKTCRKQFGDRSTTGEDGSYSLKNIPAGTYTLWIHWEQNSPPGVPLLPIPAAGYYFATLSVEKVGDARVEVGIHEQTSSIYEIDIYLPSFAFTAEAKMKIDFQW